jgi:RNA polymerase sigma factor (sigma-70 family)
MPDALDDFFIRRFARERDRGNMPAALEIWTELCVRSYDRVRGRVKTFQFPGGSRLPRADHDEATQDAFERVLAMGTNFRGHTGAEFRAALKRACWYACMDYGRELMAEDQHIGGSLDERYADTAEAGRFDSVVEAYLRERADLEALDEAAEESRAAAESLVHWAIGQIDNDNYRIVLELTFIERLSGEEIAERLDITLDNVYQRRKRALAKLEKILRDHRP